MKIKFTILFCSISSLLYAQTFIKQWDYRYGGNSDDQPNLIKKTLNGNLIITGGSNSSVGGDKSEVNRGPLSTGDGWIVCLDSNGTKLWDKTLGGNRNDALSNIIETPDHFFILCGYTNSDSSGDISHPDNDLSLNTSDGLVIKIDSNGKKIWDKRYGGVKEDAFSSIANATGGGFLLGGYSFSGISGDKSDSSRGGSDFWIVKIDSAGNKQWDKTYGGNRDDNIAKIVNTYDGGYLLVGESNSDSGSEKSQPNWDTRGTIDDYWIVKIESNGNKEWDRRFGGVDLDGLALESGIQTSDSGFLISGTSYSPIGGDRTAPLLGASDSWLVKIDKSGNKLWDKKYGGFDAEFGGNISLSSDGGFLLAEGSYSGIGGDKTQANLTSPAYWIVKIDSNGNKIWDKTLQLNGTAYADDDAIEADNANFFYVLCGPLNAGIGGDKSQDCRGMSDYWISKWRVDYQDGIKALNYENLISLWPNPVTDHFTIHNSQFAIEGIEIYNVLGQPFYKSEIVNRKSEISIDVSTFSAGIYFVQVSDKMQRAVLKFLKE